jgi:hypothetical protein
MFEENRDQNRLKRPGSRSIDSGLHMKPCLFKKSVKELLIFFSQASPKLPPFLDFLFQNPAKRKNRSSHHSCSVSVTTADRLRVRENISSNFVSSECSVGIYCRRNPLNSPPVNGGATDFSICDLRSAICNSVIPFSKIIFGPSPSKSIFQTSLEN